MERILLYVAVGVVLGLLLVFRSKFIISIRTSEEPLYKRKEFLNLSEKKVFEFLQRELPNNYVIFPQIVVGSILRPDVPRQEFWKYRSKIDKKTIDFVVFKKEGLVPLLAIGYDGPTHKRTRTMIRDEFVDNALKSAGIKSIHIEHEKNLNLDNVRSEVLAMLS